MVTCEVIVEAICYNPNSNQVELLTIRTPYLRQTSNFAEYTGRDAMLAAIWPAVGQSWARDLQVIGGGSEFVARFVVESKERPPVRMAEYVRFEGDRIAEVETYLGRAEPS